MTLRGSPSAEPPLVVSGRFARSTDGLLVPLTVFSQRRNDKDVTMMGSLRSKQLKDAKLDASKVGDLLTHSTLDRPRPLGFLLLGEAFTGPLH